MVTIERVMVGTPRELLPGEMSAIWKDTVAGPVHLGEPGLVGDGHAYHAHGGPDKALFHYAGEHYRMWADRFDSARVAAGMSVFDAGDGKPVLPSRTLFGENILTLGMTEHTVCLADRYRIGESVVVEVSQPRQPCWKLGYTSGAAEIPAIMQEMAATGWYYRVLHAGPVAAGDSMELESRPLPEWTLARMIEGFYGTPDDRGFLEELDRLTQLSNEWRTVVRNRLSTGTVEDWNGRLYR